MLKFRKVILIMTDTQRWDMCGCYRDTGLKTPQIDSLAESGVRFEKAYTTQPVCQPARAGIFTGMYPNACASWSNSMGISDNALTLGQRLSDNGVHTAYIGKWHLDGGDYFGTSVCPAGWDTKYWYDMRNFLEELTEEELELFDLLRKEKFTIEDEKRVKLAAKELYATLVSRKSELFIVGWQNDPQPKEKVRSAIVKCLNVSLPDSYDRDVFTYKSNMVYQHIVDQAMTGYAWVS